MTEVPSQAFPDIKTNEQTMRGLADEELGSLVQEEVDLDVQIEAKKMSIEQKRASGQNTSTDAEFLETLEQKRRHVAVALELSAQKHGYELSTEMGDNTHNILIDGVLKKQEKEAGVSMISSTERDTISDMESEKPPTTTESQAMGSDNKEPILETTPSSIDAKSLREEVVRLDLERSVIMNNTRHREPIEEERVALSDITERMVALKEKLSSLPPEEQVVIASGAKIESTATPETETFAAELAVPVPEKNDITAETLRQQPHVEGFSPANALEQTRKEIDMLKQKKEEILKNIRDHTTIGGYVEEGNKVNRRIEELENTLRNPEKLNQQEINDARDVETPSVEAHLNTGVNTTTPDSATHIKATGEIIPNLFEKSITRIRSEDPKRAERLLATIGASPEQKERIEKLLGATQAFTEKTETIEKEKDSWVVERASKIGEWYRRLPLKYKLAAATVFMSSASVVGVLGGAGIGMVIGAAFVGSTGQRFLGSLAMFATVEGILTKRSLARNEEEEKIMGVRMNVILGALAGSGVFFGGKLLGEFLSAHLGGGAGSGAGEKIVSQVKVPPAAPENIPGLSTKELYAAAQEQIHKAMPLPHEATAETVSSIMTPDNELVGHAATTESTSSIMTPNNEIISHASDKIIEADYLVHGGDNLWNIIKEKIPEIQNLDGEGRQSNAIANIIEQIKKDPEGFGITSGNVDTLSLGDTIDLEKVRGVLDNTKISVGGHEASIIERASGLTDIEASHIMENNAKISAWHTAHPDTLLTTETVDKILSGHDVSTTTGVEHSSTIDTAEKYANVRKDMESIEATSMKTTEILRADVQTMFGSKGFFGYGFLGTNGERSIDWLDLKGRTVDEILSKKFVGVPTGEEGAVQKFGIDSFSAVDKMREYIYMLVEKAGAGTIPEPNESVEHFSKRAINVIISKK